MSNNTNTATAMSNTNTANTTATMSKSKFHIVLRDKHHELVSWRGFADGGTAFSNYVRLCERLIEITEGDFHWVEEGVKTYLANSNGMTLSLRATTPKLLMEIIFCDTTFVADMFHDFFEGELD